MRLILIIAWFVVGVGCGRQAEPAVPLILGEQVVSGKTIEFPTDHGAHNSYGLEWWYLTANLHDQDGGHHGVQYTLFRFIGPEQEQGVWWDGQWYMGHLMWEYQGKHQAWERFGRGAGQSGVQAKPFAAWLDNWRLESVGDSYLPLALTATVAELGLDLTLDNSPLILHGDEGYSDKSGDGKLASYYYSLPRLLVSGTIDSDDKQYVVSGTAWLDREWSSALLDDRFSGWDWFSLNFDDGDNMMLFCLRGKDTEDNCEATWINAKGDVSTFSGDKFSLSRQRTVKIDGAEYPVEWNIRVPHKGIDVLVRSRSDDQLNRLSTTYWEGPVVISGTDSGYGFIEMTGR